MNVPFTPDSRDTVTGEAVPVRGARLLSFSEDLIESGADCCWSVHAERPTGLDGLATMVIGRATHSVMESRKMILTYVQRHSPSGLHWRDSRGEAVELAPGGLFVSRSSQDTLLEMSAASFGQPCACLQMTLRGVSTTDSAALVTPDDVPFSNSIDACVRVLLGHYVERGREFGLPAPVHILDIDLAPMSELELPVAIDHEALAVLGTGSLRLQGAHVEAPCAIAFSGCESTARLATDTGASLLWLAWQRPAQR